MANNNRNRHPNRNNDRSSVYHEARRQFHLMMAPYRQQIRQNIRQGRQDVQQQNQRVSSVYDTLGQQLAALNDPYQAQIAGISSGLSSNIGNLTPFMNQNIGQAPPSERAAAAGVIGAIGTGALSQLATGAATQAGYNTSAQRQGIEESAISQRNALQDFGNFKQDQRQQLADVLRQAPAQIKQLISDIDQRNLQNHLALANLALQRMTTNSAVGAQNASTAQAAAVLAFIQQWVRDHPNQPLPAGIFG